MSAEPVRLSQLGAGPEAVLRIVGYFDGLDEASANVDTVLRSAALVAEAPVGARWAGGPVIRYDGTGRLDPAGQPPEAPADPAAPAVWLERAAAPHPLDAVLLDRVRHLLRMAATRVGAPVRLGDPALLAVVLSETEPRAERVRAVRLLGLDETREVRVIAVTPADALPLIAAELPGYSVHAPVTDTAAALLCYAGADVRALSDRLDAVIARAFPPPLPSGSGPGLWVGIGAATGVYAAAGSWQQAQRALRFASSTGFGRRAVAYERLSALDLLAELPLARVLRHPDIAALNRIAASPAGAQEVDTAEAFCVLGSLRRAAAQLHLHHSTVAARLDRIEAAMGWDLGDPIDRFMATLLLVVRRVCLSSAELAGDDPTSVG